MKKILLLVGLITSGSQGINFLSNPKTFEIETKTERNTNLTDIKIEEVVINVNKLSLLTEEDLVQEIISRAFENNEEYTDIFSSLLIYPDSWILLSLPSIDHLPTINQEYSFNFKALPKPNLPYEGFLTLPIKLINKDEYDISEFITVTNLGTLINTDRNIFLNRLIELNGLKATDISKIKVETIDYSHAVISGEDGWSGTLEITYTTRINSSWFTEWDSGLLSVNSYSGWNESSETSSSSYAPVFGKQNFINYFKNIKINLYKYSYLGHNGIIVDTDSALSIDISNHPKLVTVFDNQYNNVNEEYSKATINTNWANGELLTFSFLAEARTWGYWGNAYYAYAKSQLTIKSIEFTI